ncbi:hypothetical protein EDD40_2742 [Saccharothrix texasensis]|uniref:Uncharacterized protein n=1 Tax=Saccharothrix texasensis TaxID=103734 RepID=A0A3N1H4H2_9PSEU|nr:hypothetical protein EDD40_2742 [Saccharothrix texasensis]
MLLISGTAESTHTYRTRRGRAERNVAHAPTTIATTATTTATIAQNVPVVYQGSPAGGDCSVNGIR